MISADGLCESTGLLSLTIMGLHFGIRFICPYWGSFLVRLLMLKLPSALVPIVLSLVVAGCSKPEATVEPIRAVKVVTVGIDRIETGAEFAGEVRARVETRLGFRVAGKIIQRPVEVGQRVKPGQLLAQLDSQDYRLAAEAAKAQVSAAATNRNLAATEYKRFKELKDQNFISGAELERRDTALKAGDASWSRPRHSCLVSVTRPLTPISRPRWLG